MARLAIAAAGAGIGFAIGGPFGARVGWTAGAIIGGLVVSEKTKTEGPRLSDLKVMSADEGADIPAVYGSMRVAGTVIWAADIHEEAVTTTEGGKGGPRVESTTYKYYGSMLVALHDGEITGVRKIWADSKLLYSAADDITPAEAWRSGPESLQGIRVYKGTETQTADTMYQAAVGAANAPAFRGVAYLAFEDFDLSEYGNRIPNITAEVVTGTSDPPPVQLNDFSGTDAAAVTTWADAACKDGVLYKQTWDAVSSATIVWTLSMYDLSGAKIGEKQRSFDNPFASTNIDIWGCKGDQRYGWGRKNAAGSGSGVSRFFWKGIDAGQPVPGGGATNYAYMDSAQNGGMLLHSGYLYLLTADASNVKAIVRYPFWSNGAPAMLPDKFFSLAPYLDIATEDVGQLSSGEDGNIYCSISANVDDAVHFVVIVDSDLVYVDYLDLTDLGIASARYSLWVNKDGDRLGMMYGSSPPAVRYIDISDRQNPVLLGSTSDTDLNGEQETGLAIGNGLYVTVDGIFSFNELIANTGVTLQSIVDDLCDKAGIEAANLDTSALSSITVHGYVRPRVMSARAALEPLRQAYFFDLVASDDKLKAVLRGGASAVTIAPDAMVTATGDQDSYPVEHVLADELSLPAEVSVGFVGKDNDYQPGARRSRRYVGNTTSGDGTADISLPIAMSSGGGAQIAELLLRTAWAEGESYRFRLPPKYAYLEPGDVVSLTMPNGTIKVRIIKFDLGVDYTSDVEAVRDFGDYVSSAPDITSYVESTINLVGPTLYEVIDVACLRDADDAPGYYVAMTGVYSAWPGAILFTSPDGGTYGQTGTITQSAHIGVCTTAPSNAVTTLGYDTTSAVVVDLFNDALALTGVTEADFLNGANVALMGDEVIAFKDVTDNGNGSYTLRTLLRGLCGTHDRMSGHANHERFVLLTGNGVLPINGVAADSGVDKYMRFVTISTALEAADTEAYTLTNARVMPIAPVQVSAAKYLDGLDPTWGITWVRSARIAYEWTDLTDTPLDETTESYEIDILTDAGAVVRTIAASTTSATYTYAQQIADFGHVVETLSANIYQLSDRVGRGFVATLSAPSPVWAPLPTDVYRLPGLVAGWEMSNTGTLTDASPNNVDLVWNSYPTGSSDVPYTYGVPSSPAIRSAPCTTTSHYATAPNNAAWTWDREITVIAWFKSTMTPGTTYVVPFISKYDTATDSGKSWRIGFNNTTDGQLRFSLWTTGGSEIKYLSTNVGFNDGAWHFVAGVRESGATRLYVDGVLQTSTGGSTNLTSTAAIQATTTNIRTCRHSNLPTGDTFAGNLGFVGVYNYALTAAQITTMYNRSLSGVPNA